MEKTIKIGEKEVRLSNNIGWTMTYRDQFNKDIVPAIMPLLVAIFDVISGLIDEDGVISSTDILRKLDGDKMLDAVIHLSGLELVEVINITWALAKEVDNSIPEPKIWVRQFDNFPLDEVVPAIFTLIAKGMMTSKNWERLKSLKVQTIQPLTSTQSYSQDLKED